MERPTRSGVHMPRVATVTDVQEQLSSRLADGGGWARFRFALADKIGDETGTNKRVHQVLDFVETWKPSNRPISAETPQLLEDLAANLGTIDLDTTPIKQLSHLLVDFIKAHPMDFSKSNPERDARIRQVAYTLLLLYQDQTPVGSAPAEPQKSRQDKDQDAIRFLDVKTADPEKLKAFFPDTVFERNRPYVGVEYGRFTDKKGRTDLAARLTIGGENLPAIEAYFGKHDATIVLGELLQGGKPASDMLGLLFQYLTPEGEIPPQFTIYEIRNPENHIQIKAPQYVRESWSTAYKIRKRVLYDLNKVRNPDWKLKLNRPQRRVVEIVERRSDNPPIRGWSKRKKEKQRAHVAWAQRLVNVPFAPELN